MCVNAHSYVHVVQWQAGGILFPVIFKLPNMHE
jgi:hypothetical protein